MNQSKFAFTNNLSFVCFLLPIRIVFVLVFLILSPKRDPKVSIILSTTWRVCCDPYKNIVVSSANWDNFYSFSPNSITFRVVSNSKRNENFDQKYKQIRCNWVTLVKPTFNGYWWWLYPSLNYRSCKICICRIGNSNSSEFGRYIHQNFQLEVLMQKLQSCYLT